MAKNIGPFDRMLRIFAGVVLIAVGDVNQGWVRWLAAAGVVLLVTGFLRFCPAYWVMGRRRLSESQA